MYVAYLYFASVCTDAVALPEPEPLSSAKRKDAEPFIEVFGERPIVCIFSKVRAGVLALRRSCASRNSLISYIMCDVASF